MNIGTHFDYNNHIVFISTHTRIGIPHEKAHTRSVQMEMNFLIRLFLNVAATFASVYLRL